MTRTGGWTQTGGFRRSTNRSSSPNLNGGVMCPKAGSSRGASSTVFSSRASWCRSSFRTRTSEPGSVWRSPISISGASAAESSWGAFLSYTTEGQQSYTFRWRRWTKHREVPSGGVLQEERSFLGAGGGYRKTLTRRFYGIGPSTQERQESSYTDEVAFLDLGPFKIARRRIRRFRDRSRHCRRTSLARTRPRWGRGARRISTSRSSSRKPTPMALAGSPPGFRWDTRDSQRNPYRGTVLGASVKAALLQSGWSTGAIYRLYADQIVPVWGLFHDGGTEDEEHPPTDSLAIHFETQLSSGDLPFFSRPSLGGDRILRGYIAGRWRDDAAWALATEYRFWLIPRGFTVWRHIRVERLGAAIFYEVGGVAEDGVGFFHERVRQSYGIKRSGHDRARCSLPCGSGLLGRGTRFLRRLWPVFLRRVPLR